MGENDLVIVITSVAILASISEGYIGQNQYLKLSKAWFKLFVYIIWKK